jgi:hypothetical protein
MVISLEKVTIAGQLQAVYFNLAMYKSLVQDLTSSETISREL